ncbi:MAG: HlyD family secretion protein [Alloprevotella sp.]
MKKKKHHSFVLSAALSLLAVIAVFIVVGLTLPEQPDIIQGEVETTDYRLSSKVAARVLELRVEEGDSVCRGDTLAILEAPEIEAKLSQAESAYEAARAQQEKAEGRVRHEQVTQAYEMWQKALAGMNVAEKTYRRLENLCSQGVVSEQKRDEAKAQYEAMVATEKAARAGYEMTLNGAQREDREAARAQSGRAKGAVAEVQSYVGETVLTATADGVVTEIFPEQGELVGAGAPIMNVAKTDDVWFVFNVREDLLPGLSVGSQVEVYMPAYDRRVKVEITRLKDVGTFAAWKATKALDGFDLKTFEVKARPVRGESIMGLRSGMSAIIERQP